MGHMGPTCTVGMQFMKQKPTDPEVCNQPVDTFLSHQATQTEEPSAIHKAEN